MQDPIDPIKPWDAYPGYQLSEDSPLFGEFVQLLENATDESPIYGETVESEGLIHPQSQIGWMTHKLSLGQHDTMPVIVKDGDDFVKKGVVKAIFDMSTKGQLSQDIIDGLQNINVFDIDATNDITVINNNNVYQTVEVTQIMNIGGEIAFGEGASMSDYRFLTAIESADWC